MDFFPYIPFWIFVVKIKNLTEKSCDIHCEPGKAAQVCNPRTEDRGIQGQEQPGLYMGDLFPFM